MLVAPDGEAQKRDAFERCDAFRERCELRVICGSADVEAFAPLGVPVQGWRPAGIFGMARAIARLRKTTVAFDPDAILANGWAPIATALGTFPTRYAARTLAFFHDSLRSYELPKKYVDRKLSNALRRAGAVACVSPSLARALEVKFGLDEGAIAVIPHGIAPSLDLEELARPPLRLGPVLGWIGPLGADRAWETAIDAFALVREECPDATLVMAGDGKARQFVAGHARQRGVADAITFERRIGARELFARIDLLLVPDSRDGQPHSVLEALAYGVPIVAANAGALADALGEMETAWLVPDDAEGLSEGALDAWDAIDDAWHGAMAQRSVARERYARARVDGEVWDILMSLAGAVPAASVTGK